MTEESEAMPIKIRRADYLIEVDTEPELRVVLNVLGGTQVSMPLPMASVRPSHKGTNNPPPVRTATVSGENFRRFYHLTEGKRSREAVKALWGAPRGLSDAELCTALGLQGNLELAGTSSGIIKTERKAGLPDQSVVKREKKGRPGAWKFRYMLTDAFRDAVKDLIPELGANSAQHTVGTALQETARL